MEKGKTIDILLKRLKPFEASNQPITEGSLKRLHEGDLMGLYQTTERIPRKKGKRYGKKKEKILAIPSSIQKKPFVDEIEAIGGYKMINPIECSYIVLITFTNYLRHNT